jgi:hypothetical protein
MRFERFHFRPAAAEYQNSNSLSLRKWKVEGLVQTCTINSATEIDGLKDLMGISHLVQAIREPSFISLGQFESTLSMQ